MAEELPVKIIGRRRNDGSTEISLLDPKTGREARPGTVAKDDREARKIVSDLAEMNKRASNSPTYREL